MTSKPSRGGLAAPPRTFNIPELPALKRLRDMAAVRGDRGTPEDSVRVTIYRLMIELLRLAGELKRRVERGERCRIVEVEQATAPATLHVKFKIEPVGGP